VSRKVVAFSPMTPPLKWAGGKRWLLPDLKPLWEPYRQRRLVEPFCGGLAVALGLQPDQALLNDVNPHLINFYQWLKQGLVLDIELANAEALFYSQRERFNRLIREGNGQSQEAAALFYYLNRTCFNGLCRFNQKGEFNVPFGSYKRINYTEDFSAYSEVLAQWEFTCQDFEQLTVAEDDFIYADPPYDVEFRQYSKDGFPWEDQVRLAAWLVKHPGPVVLSNQATDRIVGLYKDLGFDVRYLDAPRRISCTGDRTPAHEVLAIRNIGEIKRLSD
jgi:DNA adenine methylase